MASPEITITLIDRIGKRLIGEAPKLDRRTQAEIWVEDALQMRKLARAQKQLVNGNGGRRKANHDFKGNN